MFPTDRYARIPCLEIRVNRDTRQRRTVDPTNLLESIRMRGVYNPIIVTEDLVLVAGERRLVASIQLGLPDIPVRFLNSLSAFETELVELEENLKRSDLPWRDTVSAIGRLHHHLSETRPGWTASRTALEIGIGEGWTSINLRVFRDLDHPRIAQASSIREAYNVLARLDERRVGDAVSDLLGVGKAVFSPAPKPGPLDATDERPRPIPANDPDSANYEPGFDPPPSEDPTVEPPESIRQLDFLRWAPLYEGPRFSFIHCDFPFGVNVFGSTDRRQQHDVAYDDDPLIYWTLLECLCTNLDRIMAASGHLMFWFSMEHYQKTLDFFRAHAPSLEIQAFPLLWLKSDNVGMVPDVRRQPRRVYETAFIASREDRPILKPLANAYPCPTDKSLHASTKPEPMLRHFFSMFVDEHSKMFDPTCGSGSSIRAAESLGAELVLGLEKDPEHCHNAQSALRKFRILRGSNAR